MTDYSSTIGYENASWSARADLLVGAPAVMKGTGSHRPEKVR